MSIYPNNRITLNLTTVNAVRPLRGRHHWRIHTASSASLHMRLSNVGPLRGPMHVIVITPKPRMNPNSRQNARRKATFQPVKRGLLPCKRQQTGNQLTISHLQTAQQDTPRTATNARKTPPAKQPDTPTCGRRQPASGKQKNRWRHHDAIGLNSEYNLL